MDLDLEVTAEAIDDSCYSYLVVLFMLMLQKKTISSIWHTTKSFYLKAMFRKFVELFVFCRILIHFCQSARASQPSGSTVYRKTLAMRARKSNKLEKKPRKIKWRLINFFYWSYILTIVVKSAKNSTDRKFTRKNSTQAILQNFYIYLISSSPSVYGIIILCFVFPKLYFCC